MKIEIKIDKECTEPRIIIVTDKMTDEIQFAVQKLSAEQLGKIAGYRDDTAEILEPEDVIRFYAESGKVVAETAVGLFTIRLRLYELEQRLDPKTFVRISHSEIVNLGKVKKFDLSFAGTICVSLSNGTTTFVSRRYVGKIKKILGL